MTEEVQSQRPTLKRRSSSTLSIEHEDFEWLKFYFQQEQSARKRQPSLEALPVPQVGQKHKHDALLFPSFAAMSPHPHLHDDDSVEEDGHKRRKIGWTNTEDLTILAAVRRVGTQWDRIADQLPGRTADAVRNRWHRLQKTHQLKDTEEGRSALDGLLVASGIDPDWCPPDLVTATPAEPQHAAAHSQPQCIRGSDHGRHVWTAEEDRIIEDGVRRLGCKWRQIAALLPNRTDSSVRNRWMRLCKEKDAAREGLPGAAPTGAPSSPASTAPATDAAPEVSAGEAEPSDMEALEELSSSLKLIEIEGLPRGLETPMTLVDLDSFAEAVAACIDAELSGSQRSLGFTVDEAMGTHMAAARPRTSSRPSERDASGACACLGGYKLASLAIAAAAVVAVGATVYMRSRRR